MYVCCVDCSVLRLFVCFQGEGVKNSSGQGDEAQVISEGRTRSVRSLGTAELIRPQKLKYFESKCHLPSFSFSSFFLLLMSVLENTADFLVRFIVDSLCLR